MAANDTNALPPCTRYVCATNVVDKSQTPQSFNRQLTYSTHDISFTPGESLSQMQLYTEVRMYEVLTTNFVPP